jgi:HSP20 family protein
MTAGDPRRWMWNEACVMLERAEQLHRQFFQPAIESMQPDGWEPPIDIFESDRELSIVAALPGVEPQDLAVAVEDGALVVAGRRRLPAVATGDVIRRLEIPYGRFERRVRLPAGRLELRRSELMHGCLFISLAKRP